MTNEDEQERKDEKTVTIKGVKRDLFEKVKRMAYESGKTIGELTNRAYESLIASAQGIGQVTRSFQKGLAESSAVVISSIKELSVDGEEIRREGKRVVFRDVERLTITNLTDEIIESYIGGIEDVKELKVTGSFSKIKLLSRCSDVEKIAFG